MVRLMLVMCGFVFAFGIFASIEVTTTFQHVVAGVSYVCACILFIGAAIVRAIEKLRADINKQKAQALRS
jgi:hypothetical protein